MLCMYFQIQLAENRNSKHVFYIGFKEEPEELRWYIMKCIMVLC